MFRDGTKGGSKGLIKMDEEHIVILTIILLITIIATAFFFKFKIAYTGMATFDTILRINSPPIINISNTTITEGDALNISRYIIDPDNDPINFTCTYPFNVSCFWQTTIIDSGTYVINISAWDSLYVTNKTITIIVNNYVAPTPDTSGGGGGGSGGGFFIPDFNESEPEDSSSPDISSDKDINETFNITIEEPRPWKIEIPFTLFKESSKPNIIVEIDYSELLELIFYLVILFNVLMAILIIRKKHEK